MSTLRIASLVPAATDLVAALGLAGNLVGVSHECDHPAAAGLPVLTTSSIPAAGASVEVDPAAVDAAVSATIAAGESLYRVDRERLAALTPDVVVSQDICDVCAVSGSEVVDGVPPGADLITLHATSLDGLADDVGRLAERLGVGERAEECLADLTARRSRVHSGPRPSVVALEWGDPPFLGGHWVPELIDAAGGVHLLGRPGEPSRRSTWAEITEADPDVVIFLPCGYQLDVAVAEAERLIAGPAADLRALREGRFWVAHANRLFSRCTLVASAAIDVVSNILLEAPVAPADATCLRSPT